MISLSATLELSLAGATRGQEMAESRICGNLFAIPNELGGLCSQETATCSGGFAARTSRLVLNRRHVRVRMSSTGQEGEPEKVVGNKQVQDQLVKMLRLQTGKMRVRDFVDERSSYLSNIAEQAKAEGDKIAEDILRGIEEAGSKVLKRFDADAQAFEDELASARAEIEANEKDFDEFEKNVEIARSEGLFFKSLYRPMKSWKSRSLEERNALEEQAAAISEVAKTSAGSKSRRYLYGVLIFLLTLTLVETVSAGDFSWRKFAIYGGVLAFLLLQFSYEKSLASGSSGQGDRASKEDDLYEH
eukprot:TRINITY_DN2592_c0_g1_i3.p1 TRINITY_DN2592_c0_g1~~TRINITY_DN2592_c0_g1_i3.p1  ORF type:complete len:302 (-),score=65.67 TRINITY_DN2592_c0_g1_i3:488-1393(-)